jgi:hypothetical protein
LLLVVFALQPAVIFNPVSLQLHEITRFCSRE